MVTARSPGRQSTDQQAMFIASVAECVNAIESTSVDRIAAIPARASSIRSKASSSTAELALPVRSSHSAISFIACAVSRGSGPTEPVLR